MNFSTLENAEMNIFVGLILIFLGVLSASSFIAEKHRATGKQLKKLTPYQGWIGIAAMVYGIYIVIDVIRVINAINDTMFEVPDEYLVYLFACIFLILLGFIIAGELISSFFKKNKKAKGYVNKPYEAL